MFGIYHSWSRYYRHQELIVVGPHIVNSCRYVCQRKIILTLCHSMQNIGLIHFHNGQTWGGSRHEDMPPLKFFFEMITVTFMHVLWGMGAYHDKKSSPKLFFLLPGLNLSASQKYTLLNVLLPTSSVWQGACAPMLRYRHHTRPIAWQYWPTKLLL